MTFLTVYFNMKKLRILPYKMFSKGAKNLSRSLGGLKVYHDRNYKPRNNHLIVNWGSSILPNWYDLVYKRGVTMLNNPIAVAKATNKLITLNYLKFNQISHIEYTDDIGEANDWLECGVDVVERHTISGTKGQGIRIVKSEGEEGLQLCPLYTKMISNAREYRVHVFKNGVIDIQQKKRRNQEGEEDRISGGIKNLTNGWVFCRENITEYPEKMLSESIKAVSVLGLDFGAVDILVKGGEVYILEVNTAIGMEGTTLLKYCNEIKKLLYA